MRSPIGLLVLVFGIAVGSDRASCQVLLAEFEGDMEYDFFGTANAVVGDMDGDAVPDWAVGAPIYYGDYEQGYVRIFSSRTHAIIRTLQASWPSYPPDGFGEAIADVGDFNGDGFPEIAVGAPWEGGVGIVRIFSGIDGSEIGIYQGTGSDDYGFDLATTDDLTGDGKRDLIISGLGSDYVDVVSPVDGSLYLRLFGAGPGFTGFGWSVASVGDANGDGRSDILIGAPSALVAEVFLYSGRDGTLLRRLTASAQKTALGISVASVGDLNGDGVREHLVAEPGADSVAVDSGRILCLSGSDWTVLATIDGAGTTDSLGFLGCDSVGDVNGDGTDDFAASGVIDFQDGRFKGSARLYSGATFRRLYAIDGFDNESAFGSEVTAAGDADGDGFGDIMVGSPYEPAATEAGRARVFAGNDLFLEVTPRRPGELASISVRLGEGNAAALFGVFLIEVDHSAAFVPLFLGSMDPLGWFETTAVVPSGLSGHEFKLQGFSARGPRHLAATEPESLVIQ